MSLSDATFFFLIALFYFMLQNIKKKMKRKVLGSKSTRKVYKWLLQNKKEKLKCKGKKERKCLYMG